jgi:hypothetical protein
MKPTILLAAAITLTGGICVRAQQSDPENIGKASASEETQSTRCKAMCAVKYSSQNPANLLAWDQELNLSNEQRAGIRAIEDKASHDAKDLLTAEQRERLKELATSQPMMQCMQPVKHAGPTGGENGNGMSVGCSQAHGQAEGAHPFH